MLKTQDLQTLLEELVTERADVDAVVDKKLREFVCERFPGSSYEEIIASGQNEQKIAELKIELLEKFISIFNRDIALIEAVLAEDSTRDRETANAAIATPAEADQ